MANFKWNIFILLPFITQEKIHSLFHFELNVPKTFLDTSNNMSWSRFTTKFNQILDYSIIYFHSFDSHARNVYKIWEQQHSRAKNYTTISSNRTPSNRQASTCSAKVLVWQSQGFETRPRCGLPARSRRSLWPDVELKSSPIPQWLLRIVWNIQRLSLPFPTFEIRYIWSSHVRKESHLNRFKHSRNEWIFNTKDDLI